MMDFEGKNTVISKVMENSQYNQKMKMLLEKNQKLTELVNRAYGTQLQPEIIESEPPETIKTPKLKKQKTRVSDDYLGAERLKEIKRNLRNK